MAISRTFGPAFVPPEQNQSWSEGWKSIRDGADMPPPNTWVLCAWDDGSATCFDPHEIEFGKRTDGLWILSRSEVAEDPTHWKPIDLHIPNLDASATPKEENDDRKTESFCHGPTAPSVPVADDGAVSSRGGDKVLVELTREEAIEFSRWSWEERFVTPVLSAVRQALAATRADHQEATTSDVPEPLSGDHKADCTCDPYAPSPYAPHCCPQHDPEAPPTPDPVSTGEGPYACEPAPQEVGGGERVFGPTINHTGHGNDGDWLAGELNSAYAAGQQSTRPDGQTVEEPVFEDEAKGESGFNDNKRVLDAVELVCDTGATYKLGLLSGHKIVILPIERYERLANPNPSSTDGDDELREAAEEIIRRINDPDFRYGGDFGARMMFGDAVIKLTAALNSTNKKESEAGQ